ncbi:MAG: ATP-binding protein [Bacteroidota bacterium]
MVRIFFVFFFSAFAPTLFAQQYVTRQYRVENGLPTDMIKAISQDSDGNLWIATDEGFVKYDGARFENYPKATHSNYTKGFYRTRNGRLLAFGDLDLLELNPAGDTTEFKSLRQVSQAANDSTLSYPKLLYEDRQESLWVSESQAVVKLSGKKMKRYEFGLADRTPQFLRSFSFFEDGQGNLFTVSFAGNVFRYDPGKDEFVKSAYQFPGEIEFVSVLNRRLVIGALNGLYIAEPSGNGSFDQPRLASPVRSVSYVAALANGNYLVATRGLEHFLLDSAFTHKTLAVSNVNDVNHIYLSGENDIWLSTSDGIFFLQEAAFQKYAGSSDGFIECIAEDIREPLLYYATRTELHSFDAQSHVDKKITDNIKDGYFQSLVSTELGTWAANSFRVLLMNGEKIVKTFDFSDQRMFVTSISPDAEGNIWLTIPGRSQVLMIDKNLHLNTFGIQLGENGFINDVRDGRDGIYVASNGDKNYLFYKSYSDTVFHNISVPVNHNPGEDFNAFRLLVSGKTVWLATSLGLIKYDGKTAEKVFLGEAYNGMPVRSICANGPGLSGKLDGFLVATSRDLLYYDVQSGDHNLFASARNLSGISINSRSLLISRDKKVWIGTSKGIFSSNRRITERQKTLQPQFVYASIDGKRTAIPGQRVVPYNVLLSLTVSSVTFFEEERTFEYRFASEQPWQRLGGSTINVITSRPGDQQVQVRARKTGAYEWSDVSVLNFNVANPFWMSAWFYALVVLLVGLIIALTTLVVRALHIKQKMRLEAKVAERTLQLEEVNKELEAFSYSVSHDLRAPLRSIMGYAQILEEGHKAEVSEDGIKALGTIRKNAGKMNQLIDDLLRFSRVLHQGLQKTAVDSNQLVSEIVSSIRETDNKETAIRIKPLPSVMVDHGLITQVWSNLISNAVKYSSRAAQPQVDIGYEETATELIFHVKDNGAGFDMKFAQKLFGVFQRLHTDREFPGTGIGLALVKRIVTRHGGRIWAEGKVNEGAAFYFALPK